ncbi:uncharacterized protein LOC123872944 [Maniola jurtina]|uniref:uncharacterized protein LOC123872944 n=1 Tax=Maniola jurtina TaxID=191418 RepID=UPI001E6889CD|nr:uncharacterized protein LOC123872944 [Maniola jurtina]XP_045773510.1 uncharacterized protein LOC123872944 [Maniola jurtina]
MMLEFNKCCFCVPLRIGCLILGYLHLVASAILAILSIITLAAVSAVMSGWSDDGKVQIDQQAAGALLAVTVIMLLLVLVLLTFSILLVVGLHKEKKNYVKAYLIYYLVFIVLYAIVYVVRIATLPYDLGYLLSTLAEILLSVYFLLVIRSHWLTMRENNFNTA